MSRKSILVVDDEKSQREILEMILSGEGYDVTPAASGEAALRIARERRFDLALTDLKMTGMDGIELLSKLLAFDSSIIVLLLTAHGSIDSAKEALRRGAFDYLEKPFEREALLETIRRALLKLDALIMSFIGNPVFQKPGVVDAEQSAKASRDLAGIIELSEQIRKAAVRLHKAASQ